MVFFDFLAQTQLVQILTYWYEQGDLLTNWYEQGDLLTTWYEHGDLLTTWRSHQTVIIERLQYNDHHF